MRRNCVELITSLRLAAKLLPADTAKLLNEAATRLDVTSVALRESLRKNNAQAVVPPSELTRPRVSSGKLAELRNDAERMLSLKSPAVDEDWWTNMLVAVLELQERRGS